MSASTDVFMPEFLFLASLPTEVQALLKSCKLEQNGTTITLICKPAIARLIAAQRQIVCPVANQFGWDLEIKMGEITLPLEYFDSQPGSLQTRTVS